MVYKPRLSLNHPTWYKEDFQHVCHPTANQLIVFHQPLRLKPEMSRWRPSVSTIFSSDEKRPYGVNTGSLESRKMLCIVCHFPQHSQAASRRFLTSSTNERFYCWSISELGDRLCALRSHPHPKWICMLTSRDCRFYYYLHNRCKRRGFPWQLSW